MAEELQEPALPPWNWNALSSMERRAEMEDLAAWVAELQEAHGRWVRLPDCWPCHRALREELAAFWYWRERVDHVATAAAEELVRWHQSLRVSAQAWAEAFGGCRHESLGEVDEERDARDARLAASEVYVLRAVADSGRPDERRPEP